MSSTSPVGLVHAGLSVALFVVQTQFRAQGLSERPGSGFFQVHVLGVRSARSPDGDATSVMLAGTVLLDKDLGEFGIAGFHDNPGEATGTPFVTMLSETFFESAASVMEGNVDGGADLVIGEGLGFGHGSISVLLV